MNPEILHNIAITMAEAQSTFRVLAFIAEVCMVACTVIYAVKTLNK